MEARALLASVLLVTATIPAFVFPAPTAVAGHGGNSLSEAGVFLGTPGGGDHPDATQQAERWYACDSQSTDGNGNLDTRVIVNNTGDSGAIERVEVSAPSFTIADGGSPSGWSRVDDAGNGQATFVATNGGIPEGGSQVFQTPVVCPNTGTTETWEVVTTHAAGDGGLSTDAEAQHAWTTPNNGLSDTEDAFFTGVDTSPPDVSITDPAEGDIVGAPNPVSLSYQVSDDTDSSPGISCSTTQGTVETCGQSEATVTLPEGQTTVFVNATDDAGNEGSDSVTFTVDRNPPEVTIHNPDDGIIYGDDPIPVDFDATDDGTSVTSIECQVDDGSYGACPSSLDLATGTHTFSVRATDEAGHTTTESVTFEVDEDAPDVTITDPAEGSIISDVNPVTVAYDLTDDSSLSVSCATTSGSVESCGQSEATLTLPEGETTVTVTATDDAGNEGSDSVTFSVDRNPPEVTIDSPADGTLYDGDPIPVDFTATDDGTSVTSIECQVDDGSYGACPSSLDLATGTHTFSVRATDEAGHTTTESVTFEVDEDPPQVTITSPSDGGATSDQNPVAVKYDITDDSGVTVSCESTSGSLETCGQTEATFSLPEGRTTVFINVTDDAGNKGSDSVTFSVDRTDPSVTITNPDDGTLYGPDPIPLNFTADDQETSITTECQVDDGNWTACSDGDLLDLESGTHIATVRATDEAGNTASDDVTFTVDADGPNVTTFTVVEDDDEGEEGHGFLTTTELSTLSDGSKVFQVDYAVSDNLTSVDTVRLDVTSRNGTETFVSSQADGLFRIKPTADGNHTLNLTATDAFGNEETRTKTVYVDTPDDQIWAESSLDLDTPHFENETEEGDYIIEVAANGTLFHDGRSDTSILPRFATLDLTAEYYDGNDPTTDPDAEPLAVDDAGSPLFEIGEEPDHHDVTLEHGTGWYILKGAIVDDLYTTTSTDSVAFKVEKSTTEDGETTIEVTVKDAPSRVTSASVAPATADPDDTLTTTIDVEDLNGLDDVSHLDLEYRRDVGQDGAYDNDVLMTSVDIPALADQRFNDEVTVTVHDDARTNATVTHNLTLSAPIEDDASYYVNVSVVPDDDGDIAEHRVDATENFTRSPARVDFDVLNVAPSVDGTQDLDGAFFPDDDTKAFFADALIADDNFGTFADASPDATEPTELEAVLEVQTDGGDWTKVTEAGWSFDSALPNFSDTDGDASNAVVTLNLTDHTRSDLSELLGTTDTTPGTYLVDPPEGASAGSYRLSLAVTDDDGASGTTTIPFTVADVPEVTNLALEDTADDGDDLVDPGETATANVTVQDDDGVADGLDSILLRFDAEDEAGDTAILEVGGSDGALTSNDTYFLYDVDTSSLDPNATEAGFDLSVELPATLDDEATYELTAVAVPSETGTGSLEAALVDEPGATCDADDPQPADCRNVNVTGFDVANIEPGASFADQTDQDRTDAVRVDNQFYALEDDTGSEDNDPNTAGKVYIFPTVQHSVQTFITLEDENWGVGDEPTTEVQEFTVTVTDDDRDTTVGSGWDIRLLNKNEIPGDVTTSGSGGELVVDLSDTERSVGEVAADLQVQIPENADDGTYTLSVSPADEQGTTASALTLTLELEPWFKLDVDDQVGSNTEPGVQLEDAFPGETADHEDPLAVSATGNIGVDTLHLDLGTFTSEDTDETIGPGNATATLVAPNGTAVTNASVASDGTVSFGDASDEADLFGAGKTVTVEFSLDIPKGIDDADYSAPVDVLGTRGQAR